MHNPMDTARIHLEEGLRKCVRGKFTIANGNRSGTVMNLLHELNEEGKTVIIVTHDQSIIENEPYVVKI